jgi:hypothetical protein
MKNPPLEFLLACSGISLRDFELSRLNRMANIRKQLHEIEDELRQVEAEASLARWLMEHRDDLLAAGAATGKVFQHSFEFISAAAAPPSPLAVHAGRKALRA